MVFKSVSKAQASFTGQRGFSNANRPGVHYGSGGRGFGLCGEIAFAASASPSRTNKENKTAGANCTGRKARTESISHRPIVRGGGSGSTRGFARSDTQSLHRTPG